MSKVVKSSFKNAIFLGVLVLVCIGILIGMNALTENLKKPPTADLATINIISNIVDLDVTPQQALEKGYFSVAEIDLTEFNKDKGDSKNKVTAIYKGENEIVKDCIFVESETMGYGSMPFKLIVGVDSNGNLLGISHRSMGGQTYIDQNAIIAVNLAIKTEIASIGNSSKVTDAFVKAIVNNNMTASNATASTSANGVYKALSLSLDFYQYNIDKGGVI